MDPATHNGPGALRPGRMPQWVRGIFCIVPPEVREACQVREVRQVRDASTQTGGAEQRIDTASQTMPNRGNACSRSASTLSLAESSPPQSGRVSALARAASAVALAIDLRAAVGGVASLSPKERMLHGLRER